MNAQDVDTGSWSRRRWFAVVGLLVLFHVTLIFWVGERKPIGPIPPPSTSAMYMPAEQTAELPGLSDPTLFVLPNRHGFSGPAWMNVPSLQDHLKEWTEPEPSPAPAPELGRTLNEFVRDNVSRPFEVARKPEPQLAVMAFSTPANLLRTHSTYSVEGELGQRALLSPLKLGSWPAAEILTNSEVLVGVNPEGLVFSAVLLTKCGPKDDPVATQADASALNLATSARFRPVGWIGPKRPPNSPTALTWGRLVFHWHTSGSTATNTASKNS